MRPTPTRITRWARVVGRSRAPIAPVIQQVQAVVIASKGGRLTYATALLRDLRALDAAAAAVEQSLLELGAHEDRKAR